VVEPAFAVFADDAYLHQAKELAQVGSALYGVWQGCEEMFSNDPIGFAAGDANLYRYVGNQPTTLTDPSGLEPPQLTPEEIDEIINSQPTLQPTVVGGGIAIAGHGPPVRPAGSDHRSPEDLHEMYSRPINDSQRAALMDAATRAGLGDQVKEILIAADQSGPRYGFRTRLFAQARRFSTNPLQGPCGTWVVYASPAILETAASNDERIDLESYIIEKYLNASGDDLQNAIRICVPGNGRPASRVLP
jgi:RHS repeat-associated protein